MNQKIRCDSCNKVIAQGQKPATIQIKCPHCGAHNDLSKPDKQQPFATRLALEKK